MGQAPSIPTDLSQEPLVIGAGFSRTGTVSFALALERLLKGPVCHSGTAILLREESYVRKWISILNPKASDKSRRKELKEVTAGYVATTDTPAIAFTKELAELYPNAVVICSTREKNDWYKSASALFQNTGLWWLDIMFYPMPTLRWFGRWRDGMGARLESIYGVPKSEMNGPQLLTMHEEYVKQSVPPERLFFFNVKDGWEPLCKILKCPVPDEPFPRVNDGKSMQDFFEKIVKAAILRWLQIFSVIAIVTFTSLYLWRSGR